MDSVNSKNNQEAVSEAIKKMVGFMNLECQIEFKEEIGQAENQNAKTLFVSIYTPENARFLIGKNGQNLKSLEHLVRAMFVKKAENLGSIVLDVNDYRKSRTSYLVDLAKQIVTRVRSTQKAEALTPMSAYERRVVHMELASCPDIATESIGAEPNRRIVVKPYP